jgi:hypothetical protein
MEARSGTRSSKLGEGEGERERAPSNGPVDPCAPIVPIGMRETFIHAGPNANGCLAFAVGLDRATGEAVF